MRSEQRESDNAQSSSHLTLSPLERVSAIEVFEEGTILGTVDLQFECNAHSEWHAVVETLCRALICCVHQLSDHKQVSR